MFLPFQCQKQIDLQFAEKIILISSLPQLPAENTCTVSSSTICKSAIFSNHLPTTIFGKGEIQFQSFTRLDGEAWWKLHCPRALGKYQLLSIYCNHLRHLYGGKSSGFFNFCFCSPIWLQRKVRFIDLIIFRERCKLSWSFHTLDLKMRVSSSLVGNVIALYSVFIFCLFSDKPPSENQDEGRIGDSGEHQSDESRFRSQAKK